MSTHNGDSSSIWTALAAGLILGMMLCSLVMLDVLPVPGSCPAGLEVAP